MGVGAGATLLREEAMGATGAGAAGGDAAWSPGRPEPLGGGAECVGAAGDLVSCSGGVSSSSALLSLSLSKLLSAPLWSPAKCKNTRSYSCASRLIFF